MCIVTATSQPTPAVFLIRVKSDEAAKELADLINKNKVVGHDISIFAFYYYVFQTGAN